MQKSTEDGGGRFLNFQYRISGSSCQDPSLGCMGVDQECRALSQRLGIISDHCAGEFREFRQGWQAMV